MLIDTLHEQHEKVNLEDRKKVASIKKLAWDRFIQIGLPTKKSEGFEYLPLEGFARQEFSHYHNASSCFDDEIIEKNIDPDCSYSYIVMVDGEYSPELSSFDDELIHVQTLEEAYQTFGTSLRGKMAEDISKTDNPFTLLNMALFEEGIFVSIAKQARLLAPLQILHIVTQSRILHPRVYLYLGRESEGKVLTRTIINSENPVWVNECIEVWLEEKAHLNHTDISILNEDHHYYVSSVEASVKQKADYTAYIATNGSAIVRKSYHEDLKGIEASSQLKGLASLKKNHHAHIFTHFQHSAERTNSQQHMKAMLEDKSRFSFDGKIFVTQQGLYSEAYQLNNNFLLSDQAAAFSKPNLEIFADDVKASHGCTTAKISEEEMFYLTSRGLAKDDAKKLLIKAFLEEILHEIPLKGARDVVKDAFRI